MTPRQAIERRHHARRDDDPDPEIVEAWSRWFALLLKHKVKVGVVLTSLSGLGGYTLGVRDLNALAVRVTRVEERQQQLSDDVAGLKNSARFQNYVLCVQRDTTGGSQLTRLCRAIIEAGP